MSESSTLPDEAERWLPVPGYEGIYEISDQGRVRSLDRVAQTPRGPRMYYSRIMRQWTKASGAPSVGLWKDGKQKNWAVRQLVREVFELDAIEPIPGERWLPVPDFEDWYDVSDFGRVRSYHRGSGGRRERPYLLTQTAKGVGKYLMVTLHQNGASLDATVHSLVLTAFVGPRPPKNEGRHGPNGRYDNSLANLCWGTVSENHQDRRRDGDPGRYRAKLTVAVVLECRERRAAGERLIDLAREFGASSSGLCQAVKGRTWAAI